MKATCYLPIKGFAPDRGPGLGLAPELDQAILEMGKVETSSAPTTFVIDLSSDWNILSDMSGLILRNVHSCVNAALGTSADKIISLCTSRPMRRWIEMVLAKMI
jgi:hypothetical protein